MKQIRESNYLKKKGINGKTQKLIYYTLINPKAAKPHTEYIDSVCNEIAGDRWKGLKRFLTNDCVNDNSIWIDYGIRSQDLYRMKNEFYLRWYIDKIK